MHSAEFQTTLAVLLRWAASLHVLMRQCEEREPRAAIEVLISATAAVGTWHAPQLQIAVDLSFVAAEMCGAPIDVSGVHRWLCETQFLDPCASWHKKQGMHW